MEKSLNIEFQNLNLRLEKSSPLSTTALHIAHCAFAYILIIRNKTNIESDYFFHYK